MEFDIALEKDQSKAVQAPEAMPEGVIQPVGKVQVQKFTQVLQKYHVGLNKTKQRIIAAESWWKLRNTTEEQKTTNIGKNGDFASRSGWLHNVIVSKHADAMEAFPQPNVLPREKNDRGEAQKLSAIVPCVLEQNGFEKTYSDVMWQKCKTGTGAYKIIWDKGKLHGLGDIAIEKANLLNLYWEPGVDDIQKSRYFFHTELMDKDELEQAYPEFAGQIKGQGFMSSRFLYDDTVSMENKLTVIEVYYHKWVNGKKTLQYCKYAGEVVLHATENNPAVAVRGLYDHGLYPYDFDPMFPIEGSPCGYGFVDVCMNPQTEIDLMKTAFVKNTLAGSVPRYFKRPDSKISTEQFLDLSQPLVDVAGNLDEMALKRIENNPLDSVYVSMLDRTIQELRETSGNTETSTGNVSSGVTAASAIAALQEASGKGSRDATKAAYRSFERIVRMVIELIRQFYDLPRQFRIIGDNNEEEFISYTNQGIQPQHQGYVQDMDLGYRTPVFDIKVSAQRKNVYTTVTQNELALQFFQLGFFNPQMTDQALLCLDLMEFDGKDTVIRKVSQNGTMQQKLMEYMQLALGLAQQAAPEMAQAIAQDMMMVTGMEPANMVEAPVMGTAAEQKQENTRMANARERSARASQPE